LAKFFIQVTYLDGLDNNILIFDILSEKHLKRYRLLLEGENNLFISKTNIKKWNNNNDNDNEFFINYKCDKVNE